MTSISLTPEIPVRTPISIAAFLEYLTEEGYQPTCAESDELMFTFQNGRYVLRFEKSPSFYFSVMAYSIHKFEEESPSFAAELTLCQDIAASLTRDYRIAKVMVASNRVDLSLELCAASIEDAAHWFSWAMEIAYAVITQFENLRREAVSELTAAASKHITDDLTSADIVTMTLPSLTNLETPLLH